jgi:protein-tyrosine-phosphatase
VTGRLEGPLAALARRLERPAEWLLGWPRVRAWLQRRAVRAWRDEPAPLILCYGNINRSAFGVALVQRRRPAARSGGFYPVEDRCSPGATIACAARYDVDLTAHRSRRVNRAELQAAKVIFVFDLENAACVLAHSPGAWPACISSGRWTRRSPC